MTIVETWISVKCLFIGCGSISYVWWIICFCQMGFQFAGKAVYSAVWVAAFSLFMELLGFSTQKWVTAGGFGTVLLTLAGREVWDLSLLIIIPILLYFTVLVVATYDIVELINTKYYMFRYLQTSFQARWFMQLDLLW